MKRFSVSDASSASAKRLSVLMLSAFGFSACAVATPQAAEENTRSDAQLTNAAAKAAVERAGVRPPPNMRRVPAEEVKAHFARIQKAQQLAQLEAAKPANLDQLLDDLNGATSRAERTTIAEHCFDTINHLDAAARPAAVARLNQVWTRVNAR